jgi:hypothetical protein
MSKRRAFVGFALVLVGAALLSPAGGAIASLARQAAGDPPKPIAGPGEPSPALPAMTDADKAQAISILARDPSARGLLRGRAYTIEKIGPWTTLDHKKLGVSMMLKLDRPNAFALTNWPLMKYDETERSSPPFRTVLVPLSAKNVTELSVQVDLTQGRLAGLEPSGAGASITPGPGVVATRSPHSD